MTFTKQSRSLPIVETPNTETAEFSVISADNSPKEIDQESLLPYLNSICDNLRILDESMEKLGRLTEKLMKENEALRNNR